MDWLMTLLIVIGGLLVCLLGGLHVFATFLLIDIIGMVFLMGGIDGLPSLIRSMVDSIGVFTLTSVPMFIIMGEVIFVSGMATKAIVVVERLLFRLPGRLAMVAICGGALFDALSGSALGTCAMFGSLLMPEMQKRNYSKYMSMGPIMAASSLAVVIPPSTLAIVLASTAGVSIGKLLIAGFVPGFLISGMFGAFIIVSCLINPSLAPSGAAVMSAATESGEPASLFVDFVKYLLPLSFIVLAVLGSIFSGIATPTEAAALGGIASFLLAAVYRKLTWSVVVKSSVQTLNISTMIFMIVAGSVVFSQILAYTGITRGIVKMALGLNISPMAIIAVILLILLLMGTMIDQMSMIMIGVPMFMPIVKALNCDPIWFCHLMLLVITLGLLTPPFGLLLFIMRGVAPPGTTMTDVYHSIGPYIALALFGVILVLIFPEIALWLPNRM
jgi:tripartite ATP-independent transporter DctM subunit